MNTQVYEFLKKYNLFLLFNLCMQSDNDKFYEKYGYKVRMSFDFDRSNILDFDIKYKLKSCSGIESEYKNTSYFDNSKYLIKISVSSIFSAYCSLHLDKFTKYIKYNVLPIYLNTSSEYICDNIIGSIQNKIIFMWVCKNIPELRNLGIDVIKMICEYL